MKIEGESKRKFSKRKDPEFAASWYQKQGYPGDSVVEYLLGLINSNFEEWRMNNLSASYKDFHVSLGKMSKSGSLFDIRKFDDVSRNIIANKSGHEVYDSLLNWSRYNEPELYDLIKEQKDYTVSILDIGRGAEKSRKDYSKWSDVKAFISYFFDELYTASDMINIFPGQYNSDDIRNVIGSYINIYDPADDNVVWFNKIKDMCKELGYADNIKTYKKDPSSYKGHVGDVTMIIRLALTQRPNTPDLYDIMQVMGKDRVIKRLKECL